MGRRNKKISAQYTCNAKRASSWKLDRNYVTAWLYSESCSVRKAPNALPKSIDASQLDMCRNFVAIFRFSACRSMDDFTSWLSLHLDKMDFCVYIHQPF